MTLTTDCIEVNNTLKNWIPYKLFSKDSQTLCHWLKVDDKDFTEPFFDETLSRYHALTANSMFKCISSVQVLPEWSEQVESIQPAAFIFHVSRCGSTLASQLLSLSEENIVLSEVPFFDEILRKENDVQDDQQADRYSLLKAAIRFYGAKRNDRQCRLVIKTDSWHILFYEQLRKLYPGVPAILLYRHPAEVIRSQQKRRGMQSVPGMIDPELFGFDREEIRAMALDQYMGKVLEKYFQSFIEIAKNDALAFPVNYNEGLLAIVKKMATITRMPIDDEYMEKMEQRVGYHAKYPDQQFAEETPSYSPSPDDAAATALYDLLEELRIMSYEL